MENYIDIIKNPKKLNNINNLLYIDEISIERCLEILKERFQKKKIYTQLGSVLLSINPYQYFIDEDDIYNFCNNETVHIYKNIDIIIENLLKKNQMIIISGESGSGKTETTKQIIHYLNYHIKNNNSLLEKIEASGLVLECFGNAATQKNNNSSRFGKLTEVFYNNNRECIGMKISIYLLEKTRVLNKKDFGKFHVFNKKEEDIKNLLINAGFQHEHSIFVINILNKINYLLKLEFNHVIEDNNIEKLLKKKKIIIQQELIEKIYNEDEFNEIRDIFIMKLYDYLFNWLVEQMNIIYDVKSYDHKIGILDIFGFEDLKDNSLEQLSINYANEIIQGLLNKILLENKIKLYNDEGITLEVNNIQLNKEQIKLIEKIFINLDEECMLPKGSDLNLIQKLNIINSNNYFYKSHKINYNNTFSIEHYAGKIDYKIENFLKKNMDKINQEIETYINELFSNKLIKRKNTGKLKINSITNQFRNQLNEFIESIVDCELHFIKCIKPNLKEAPLYFDLEIVKEQLIYNGIIQLINILKQGYSYNFDKQYFIKEFSYVLDNVKDGLVYGKTKVFLTEETYNLLKIKLNNYRIKSIIIIQKNIRMMINKKYYNCKKQAIKNLQKYIIKVPIKYNYIQNKSAYKIQNFFKKILIRNIYNKLIKSLFIKNKIKSILIYNKLKIIKKSINIIKSSYLIYKIKIKILIKLKAIKIIQKWWKSYLKIKNDYFKRNQFLENELLIQRNINLEKEKKIILLEKKNKELQEIIFNLQKVFIPIKSSLNNIINTNNISNIENVSNVLNVENVSNTNNILNVENVSNTNNILNVENVSNTNNILNVENVSNIENILNIEDLPDATSDTFEVFIENNNNSTNKNDNDDNENENDKLIINKLRKDILSYKEDILSYKEDIDNRILEKLDLINQLETINRENKNLLRHVNYLKNNSTSWFSRFFS
jgi:myosin heavy subunit